MLTVDPQFATAHEPLASVTFVGTLSLFCLCQNCDSRASKWTGGGGTESKVSKTVDLVGQAHGLNHTLGI